MAQDTARTEPVVTGTFTQLLLGLVWLGSTLYAAHATITGRADPAPALAAVLAALPGVVAAMIVTGAAIGAVAGSRVRNAGVRLLAGLALGTLGGAVAAAGIRFAYGGGRPIVLLAITVGAAGVAGSVLAGLPGPVLRAGLWATTGVFLTGVIVGVSQSSVLRLLGNGQAANTAFALGQALVAGLVAALAGHAFLRRERNRAGWYLVAGALPGLVLFGAEWLTRAAGSAAAPLVRGVRGASPPLVQLSEPARLRYALIVLVVGGLLAMVSRALTRPRGETRPERRRAGVDLSHEVLARIGLEAGERYGFALAGGYAIQAAGFRKRPNADVDLFTVWERRADFDTATRAIVDAYLAAGLAVEVERRHDTFTRLTVSDGVRTELVELGLDRRAQEPVRQPIGPVLHPDDAVANKTRALYERAHAQDFIDIDVVLRSGRYDRSALLRLAERSDITFARSVFADALAQAQLLDADQFARYGVAGRDLEALRQRFAAWRAELLDPARPAR